MQNNKKHIVVLCTMINTFGQPGFYNSQEVGLARAIAKYGHDVTILKGLYDENAKETVEQVEESVTLSYLKIPHLKSNGYFKTSLLPQDTAAVLCFSDQQQFIPHVAKFCKKKGIAFIPYVGTAHSEFTGAFKGNVMNWLFSKGTLKLYKKDAVMAKTPSARDELMSLGVPKENIHLATVGLDFAMLHQNFESEDRKAIREKYGYTDDDTVLLGIARMVAYKNPLAFIEVLKETDDHTKLLMVGSGPLQKDVIDKAKEYRISDRLQIIDRVPYKDMWELYVMSDYFLNLNPQEIFGMAIMEAMYYKTAVIAYDAQGPRMIIGDLTAHHLCSTPSEVAKCLALPYPDKQALTEGQTAVKTRLSWDTCAKTFLKLTGIEEEES